MLAVVVNAVSSAGAVWPVSTVSGKLTVKPVRGASVPRFHAICAPAGHDALLHDPLSEMKKRSTVAMPDAGKLARTTTLARSVMPGLVTVIATMALSPGARRSGLISAWMVGGCGVGVAVAVNVEVAV